MWVMGEIDLCINSVSKIDYNGTKLEIITDGKRQTTNISSFMLAILLGDKHGNSIKIKPLSMKG